MFRARVRTTVTAKGVRFRAKARVKTTVRARDRVRTAIMAKSVRLRVSVRVGVSV